MQLLAPKSSNDPRSQAASLLGRPSAEVREQSRGRREFVKRTKGAKLAVLICDFSLHCCSQARATGSRGDRSLHESSSYAMDSRRHAPTR